MNRALRYTALILVLLGLQLGVLPPIFGSWPVPNLLLLFVLLAALMGEKALFASTALYPLAIACGLALDFFSSYRFGIIALLFLAFAILIRFLTSRWIESNINYKGLVAVWISASVLFPLSLAFFNHSELTAGVLGLMLLVNLFILAPLAIFQYVRTA